MKESGKDNIIARLISTNLALGNELEDIRRSNENLQEANSRLTRVNEDLNNFVYAASHDLLGPLGNIEASLSGIQRRSGQADFKIYLQVIDSSIKKFGKLIRNLATIAKLENDITEELADLNEIIANVTWSVQDQLEKTDAALIADLEVDKILFSKKNLRSILYNLISNAIKFKGDQPPVIKIVTKKSDNYTLLQVQDNGKGMPPAALEKIFKVYGRLDHDIEGSGIGLYLAKKLINAAGGQIIVESEEGKGSNFIIILPDRRPDDSGGSKQPAHSENQD